MLLTKIVPIKMGGTSAPHFPKISKFYIEIFSIGGPRRPETGSRGLAMLVRSTAAQDSGEFRGSLRPSGGTSEEGGYA